MRLPAPLRCLLGQGATCRISGLSTLGVLLIVTAMPVFSSSSPPETPGSVPPSSSEFADALEQVPDTPDVRGELLSFVDYRAVEEARPGAARPASYAELEALRSTDDPSARLWTAAYQGVASGSGDMLRSLLLGGAEWPHLLGFDFFDIDREIAFGAPPADGTVLLGQFDPTAIAGAFTARGYSATDVNGRVLLCGSDGCDAGTQVHVDRHDPANPFGGDLGRLQPLAASSTALDSSASGETVRQMLDTASGATPSIGWDPGYRAAAEAMAASAPGFHAAIQATIVPGAEVSADVTGIVLGGGDAARAQMAELAGTFKPIPGYELLAFADGASTTEQVVRIGLVYEDAADARLAVDRIPGRLSLPSLVTQTPLRQLLEERGVTGLTGGVVPSSDGTRSICVMTLRAPLAAAQPDAATGVMTSSSMVYHLLITMLFERDMLWLAPTLPEVN